LKKINIKKGYLLLFIIGVNGLLFAQKTTFNVSFKIVQKNNHEPIYGSMIVFNELQYNSNADGLININTKRELNIFKIFIQDSLIQVLKINARNDTFILIETSYIPADYEFKSVYVKAKKQKSNDENTFTLSDRFLKKASVPMSSGDPIHLIKILPGISHTQEMNSNINFRGGSAYNSAIYLDNIPMPNFSHSFGLFSFYDINNIRHIDFFNRKISSNYGNRGAGYLQMSLKDPNMKKSSGQLFVNPFLVSANANINLIENKLGVFAYYRKSILSEAYNATIPLFSNFQDIMVKSKFIVNKKSSVSFLLMNSTDRTQNNYGFGLEVNDSVLWKVSAISLSFDKIIKNGMEQSISFFVNKNQIARTANLFQNSSLNNSFTEYNLKYTLKNKLNKNYSYLIGAENQILFNANSIDTFDFLTKQMMVQSLFADYKYSLKNTSVYTQSRLNYFSNLHEIYPEIRIGLEHKIRNSLFFIEQNNFINQTQSLSNNLFPIAEDFRFFANKTFKPLKTNEYLLGYHLNNKRLKFQSHVYYRNYYNSLEYISQSESALNQAENITKVNHKSYGFENMLELDINKRNSLIFSYTYSRAKLQSDLINLGLEYAANYDRPHILNALYQFKYKRLEMTAQFNMMSGRPHTAPLFKLPGGGYAFSEKNEKRLPVFHKMDIGFKYTTKSKLKQEFQVYFYNVYLRRNAYAVVFANGNDDNDDIFKYRYLSTFTFLPSFSYSIKIN